ncbi:MAG TPA: hypothetical protein VFQ38_12495 [Longimicrobiales bacterium]|nr:hypothetical protein [Longimicrobiales bacterium]
MLGPSGMSRPRLRVGQLAWATSLTWRRVQGTEALQRWGHRSGRVGEATTVAVERAEREHACAGCRGVIVRRELCGRSLPGERYCAGCLTSARPATEFVPEPAAPEPAMAEPAKRGRRGAADPASAA